ncbi:MAG: class E sortase [Acidimicrobiales bacterium]
MVIDVLPSSVDEVRPVQVEEEVGRLEEELPERVGPPRPGPLAVVLAIVLFVSITALFLGVFAFGLSGLQEQRSQHQLYAEFRGLLDPSSPVAPKIGGDIPPGSPVALLTAPVAGLHDVVVVEGTSSGDMLAGPGHLRDTPLPGQSGESVLLGKSSTAGGPFRDIGLLHAGDVITVRTGQGLFHYRVIGALAPGIRPISVPATGSVMVLGTSAGSGASNVKATRLTYVEARLQGRALRVPPGLPRSVPTAELPGHSELSAWPAAALWLAVLAGTSAFVWWLWARWGLLRTWIIAAPILLGMLWALGNAVLRMVPNVY